MLKYKKTQIIIYSLLVVVMSSCHSNSKNSDELIKIVEKLKIDENHTFFKELEPTEIDCKAIFSNTWNASKGYEFSKNRWEGLEMVPDNAMKPESMDAEVLILSATVEELKKGETNGLPIEYVNIASRFKEDVTVYGIQYLNEDKTVQKTRTAFFKIKDKWVMFPRVYIAF